MSVVFSMLLGLFGCNKDTAETVTSLQNMTLTLRGMRGGTVYRFETGTDQPSLCRYREIYSDGEDRLRLEFSVVCSSDVMVGLMNSCGIIRWDGFHGEHPKNVSDGIMFRFEAQINGGRMISADGSANFPKGYHDFVRNLNEMLTKGDAESKK